MSEEQGKTMAERYARLTGKELDEATEELREGLRSAFEVSQQPARLVEDLMRLLDQAPSSGGALLPLGGAAALAAAQAGSGYIRRHLQAIEAEQNRIVQARNTRVVEIPTDLPPDPWGMHITPTPPLFMHDEHTEFTREQFDYLYGQPHNRSREEWERARAERWPDPSWSSLRKVERWEEMRREGLMQWGWHVPAYFRHRRGDRARRLSFLRVYWADRRERTIATQVDTGEYNPDGGSPSLAGRAQDCGLTLSLQRRNLDRGPMFTEAVMIRRRHLDAIERGDRSEPPDSFYWEMECINTGGISWWLLHVDTIAAEHAEDPAPTTETAPLYRDDTLGARPACEVKR